MSPFQVSFFRSLPVSVLASHDTLGETEFNRLRNEIFGLIFPNTYPCSYRKKETLWGCDADWFSDCNSELGRPEFVIFFCGHSVCSVESIRPLVIIVTVTAMPFTCCSLASQGPCFGLRSAPSQMTARLSACCGLLARDCLALHFNPKA